MNACRIVGRNVRGLRLKRGWSQEELGGRAELDRTYVGNIERAEHVVGLENLARIAKALGVGPARLLADLPEVL